MAARGAAGHADAIGVDVVPGGVRAKPPDSRLHVVDGGGERVFRREPVGDRGGDVPAIRELADQAVVSIARAGPEAAAVDAEHGGEGAVALRPGDVHLEVLAIGVRVLDVLFERRAVVGRTLRPPGHWEGEETEGDGDPANELAAAHVLLLLGVRRREAGDRGFKYISFSAVIATRGRFRAAQALR